MCSTSPIRRQTGISCPMRPGGFPMPVRFTVRGTLPSRSASLTAVSPAGSVGASALRQRCPPDTRAPKGEPRNEASSGYLLPLPPGEVARRKPRRRGRVQCRTRYISTVCAVSNCRGGNLPPARFSLQFRVYSYDFAARKLLHCRERDWPV